MKTIPHLLLWTAAALFVIGSTAALAQSPAPPSDPEIPTSQMVTPEQLVKVLQGPKGKKPLVLQVGSHVLFAEAHIPGSEYAGAGSNEGGLQQLRDRVKSLPHSAPVVLYCGCCPWGHCPNIRPAFQEMQKLGFTQVKVLYIANNFGTDWVQKGYPVAKGR